MFLENSVYIDDYEEVPFPSEATDLSPLTYRENSIPEALICNELGTCIAFSWPSFLENRYPV